MGDSVTPFIAERAAAGAAATAKGVEETNNLLREILSVMREQNETIKEILFLLSS